MTQIPARAASRLLDSVAFLNAHHGLLLNGHITMNFEQLAAGQVEAGKRALTDMNEFLARRIRSAARSVGCTADHYYVYAHERCREHGWHVHELISAPRGLLTEVKHWLREWVRDQYGTAAVERRAVVFKRLGGRSLDMQVFMQAKLVRYILKTMATVYCVDRKGQPAIVSDLLGMKRQQESEPLTIPRLAGVSQNLGLSAQLAVDYQPPAHWEDLLSIKNLWSFRDGQVSAELTEQLRGISI